MESTQWLARRTPVRKVIMRLPERLRATNRRYASLALIAALFTGWLLMLSDCAVSRGTWPWEQPLVWVLFVGVGVYLYRGVAPEVRKARNASFTIEDDGILLHATKDLEEEFVPWEEVADLIFAPNPRIFTHDGSMIEIAINAVTYFRLITAWDHRYLARLQTAWATDGSIAVPRWLPERKRYEHVSFEANLLEN